MAINFAKQRIKTFRHRLNGLFDQTDWLLKHGDSTHSLNSCKIVEAPNRGNRFKETICESSAEQ